MKNNFTIKGTVNKMIENQVKSQPETVVLCRNKFPAKNYFELESWLKWTI
jgi:hypothetical protein